MRATEGLDFSFEKLMVDGASDNMNNNDNSCGQMEGRLCGGLKISEWKDIPLELLLGILSMVDDQTVIVASGVCHGWRDAISWGLTHLSLSCYSCLKYCSTVVEELDGFVSGSFVARIFILDFIF